MPFRVPVPVARAARAALLEGGAPYIKLGQLVSTRPDLVGSPAAGVLAELQKNVPPSEPEEPWSVVRQEMPQYVDDIDFTSPVACGSIGEVFRVDGRGLVVKVLRKGVAEETVELLDRIREVVPGQAARDAVGDYKEIVLRETDLPREHRALRFYRQRTRGRVRVPRAREVTANVLAMEDVPSASLLRAGDRERRAAVALCTTVMDLFISHGVLHTDLHPGNYGIDERGRAVLYDFGSVERLPREAVQKILFGVIRKDLPVLFDGVVDAGLFRGDAACPEVLRFCGTLTGFAEQTSDLGDMLGAIRGDMPPTTNLGFGVFRSVATLDQVMRFHGITLEEISPELIAGQVFDPGWIRLSGGPYKSRYLARALARM